MATPNVADRWYYAHDNIRLGPFTGQQLHNLAETGQILLMDTVWKEGVAQGVVAHKVKSLFTAAQLVVPAAAGPAPPAEEPAPAAAPGPTDAGMPICAEATVAADDGPVAAAAPVDAIAQQPAPAPAESAAIMGPTILEAVSSPATTKGAPAAPAKKGRAVAGKGITIISQDGKLVKFKKKCPDCGHEDAAYGTAKFAVGNLSVAFFCPKCKRQRHGEIRCYSH